MVVEVPKEAIRTTAELPADEEKPEEASERPTPPHVNEQPQDKPSTKTSTTASTLTENYTDRNKNRYRKCPMCDFFGTHLERHLLAKHAGIVTSKSRAARVLAVSENRIQAENRPAQSQNLYQCGYQGCCAVVTRKGQHLKRKHKISDKETLKEAGKKFKRLDKLKRQAPPSNSKADNSSPKSKQKRPVHSEERHQPVKKIKGPASKKIVEAVIEASSDEQDSKQKVIVDSGEKQAAVKKKVKVPSSTKIVEECTETSSDEEESFHSDGDSADDVASDTGTLDREADLDEIGSFASEDDSNWEVPVEAQTWRSYYLNRESSTNVREHYVGNFHKFLLHAEGGALSEEQALIHVRQVHKVLEHLDPGGNDLACLERNQSLDVWDKFASPMMQSKALTGNTMKLYIRSLEMFIKFIRSDLFVKIPLPSEQKFKIEKLLERLPNYRSTIHRRTASQSTTRKVEETFSRLTTDDLQDLEKTEQGKSAIKLIGQATEGHVLDMTEFATVRDYLLVTVLIENGSRPGPLETAKVSRFERATFVESEEKYTILVDEQKTTRHQGPAELTVDKRIYSYLKIFVNYIRPAFVDSAAEDALFINKNGRQFQKGTIGKRVPEFFKKAGIRTDIRVTPTRVRKFYETASNQSLNTTDQQLVADHLKHQIKTARQNYVEKVNAVKATKAHGVLRSLVHPQSSATTTKPTSTEEENQEHTARRNGPND